MNPRQKLVLENLSKLTDKVIKNFARNDVVFVKSPDSEFVYNQINPTDDWAFIIECYRTAVFKGWNLPDTWVCVISRIADFSKVVWKDSFILERDPETKAGLTGLNALANKIIKEHK